MILIMLTTKKLQKYILLSLIFLIPSNLAYHFILPSSYVSGILVDYLIPTFYLTDILVFLILVLELIKIIKNRQVKTKKGCQFFFKLKAKKLLIPILLFIFIIFNISFAKNQITAIYKYLKLGQMALLVLYLKSRQFNKNDLKNLKTVLSLSIIWQSILTILQWFKQGNIFSYLILGEQPLSTSMAGIKTINWWGQLKLVPMGTFPHPNVLAGWLTLSLITLVFLNKSKNKEKKANKNRKQKMLSIITLFSGFLALFFTFSLPAWAVFLVFLLIKLLVKIKLEKLTQIALFGLIAVTISASLLIFGNPNSWNRRIKLNQIALNMWQSSPIVGVGLNNFTVKMNEFGEIVGNVRFLQPVHNIPLLILSELGIIGPIVFIFFLAHLIIKNKQNKAFLTLVLAIFILSLFDHYWLTSQQGILITACLIGMGLKFNKMTVIN